MVNKVGRIRVNLEYIPLKIETFNPLENYHEQTFGELQKWIEKYFDFDINIAHHVNETITDTHQDIIVGSTMAFTGVLFLL